MQEMIRLADFGRPESAMAEGRASATRINWSSVARFLEHHSPFVVARDEEGRARVVGLRRDASASYDLSGLSYLNLDGLVLLLCTLETLRDHGVHGLVKLPGNEDQREELLENGFAAAVRKIGRLLDEGSLVREIEPSETFILGRPFVFRADTPRTLSDVQQRMDSFLRSDSLLVRLRLEKEGGAGGENRWEWAPAIAQAMHELLKNVVQWSGIGRAFIAMEHIPRTLLRVIIADVGEGISQTNPDLRFCPFEGLDPMRWALLYRYVNQEKHGLFTVAATLARWGGQLWIRSGDKALEMSLRRSELSTAQLVQAIQALRVQSTPFLPGMQIRVDFALPEATASLGRR